MERMEKLKRKKQKKEGKRKNEKAKQGKKEESKKSEKTRKKRENNFKKKHENRQPWGHTAGSASLTHLRFDIQKRAETAQTILPPDQPSARPSPNPFQDAKVHSFVFLWGSSRRKESRGGRELRRERERELEEGKVSSCDTWGCCGLFFFCCIPTPQARNLGFHGLYPPQFHEKVPRRRWNEICRDRGKKRGGPAEGGPAEGEWETGKSIKYRPSGPANLIIDAKKHKCFQTSTTLIFASDWRKWVPT